MTRARRRVWAGAALCGAALAVAAAGEVPGLILHFLLGKLVYSTSNAATLFFLGYAALALTWAGFAGEREGRGGYALWLLPACLALGHGVHLAASLAYYRVHGLSPDAHVHHWLDGVNSYTSLLHSHLGKPALAQAASLLGIATGSYDTGAALHASLPAAATLGIAVSFLLGLGCALWLFPRVMGRLEWHPAAVILYLTVSALSLKTLLDGGVLSYRVPPSLLLLGSLLRAPDRAGLARFWRGPGWKIALALLAAYLALWLRLSAERPIPSLGGLLFTLGFYGLLLAWLIASLRPLAGLLAGLYLGFNLWVDARLNLLPYLEMAGPEHRMVLLDALGRPTPVDLEGMGGRPLVEVYARLGEDPLKPRRLLVWREAAAGSRELDCAIQPLSLAGAGGRLESTPALELTGARPLADGRLLLGLATPPGLAPILVRGEGDALSRANYYVYLHQLDGILRRAGWREYILIPATASNPPPGLTPGSLPPRWPV